MMKTYKPKLKAIQALAEMQRVAKCLNKSLMDASNEMGFDCPYSWQKALLQTVFKE